MVTTARGPIVPCMESHSFQLELPSDTSPGAAHWAGRDYLETLHLSSFADYGFRRSDPHPTKPGISVFTFNKA
jgi:hypothetical protein